MARRRQIGDAGQVVDELDDFSSDPKKWLLRKITDRKGRENEALRGEMADEFGERIRPYVWVAVIIALVLYKRTKRRRR